MHAIQSGSITGINRKDDFLDLKFSRWLSKQLYFNTFLESEPGFSKLKHEVYLQKQIP